MKFTFLCFMVVFSIGAGAASKLPPQVKTAPQIPSSPISKAVIENMAVTSACYKYQWKDRGQMPAPYLKGMALVFARKVCEGQNTPINQILFAARHQPESTFDPSDALSWYNSNYKALGETNDVGGIDTFRHLFTLQLGLGMRESSGSYCVGRDMEPGADFSDADSAEAGLFQTSYGARRVSPELVKLEAAYQAAPQKCLLDVFSTGISCKTSDAKNWGTGAGVAWQDFTKKCPAFSAEWAAVLLRLTGGSKGEYGPIRKKEAEIRPECESLLSDIQKLILANPAVCGTL